MVSVFCICLIAPTSRLLLANGKVDGDIKCSCTFGQCAAREDLELVTGRNRVQAPGEQVPDPSLVDRQCCPAPEHHVHLVVSKPRTVQCVKLRCTLEAQGELLHALCNMSVECDLTVLVRAPVAWFEQWELLLRLSNRADRVVIGIPCSTSPRRL